MTIVFCFFFADVGLAQETFHTKAYLLFVSQNKHIIDALQLLQFSDFSLKKYNCISLELN